MIFHNIKVVTEIMENQELSIYAVADLHGDYDRLERIKGRVEAQKPDVLVIAGDITGLFGVEKYLRHLAGIPLPILVIHGNMDTGDWEGIIAVSGNIISIHQRETTIRGVPFVGLGGTSPLPFSNRIGFKEQSHLAEVARLIGEDSIVVTHPPPHGVLDEVMGGIHTGSKRLRGMIEEKQPRMLICGHIHERPGWAHLGRTVVVNASMGRKGDGALILLRGYDAPEVNML